jgi:CO/xanthine dehydrogenase FAD-binding subunit
MAIPELQEFCLPGSHEDVLRLMEKYGDSALFVAGGTFLHGLEARGFLSGVEALIDLRNLGLATVAPEKGGVRAGATARFAQLEQIPGLDTPAWGALRDALDYPPVQIRNLATVGGSIAASCPFFDVPTAFQVLDGEVTVQGAGGTRRLPLHKIYSGLFENSLEPGEYIASLLLPKPDSKSASAYLKLETNANDLALVGIAVRISLGWSGKIKDPRVVLGGGLNDTCVRSPAAEAVLDGQRPGEGVFRQAAAAIDADIDPIADHRGSAEYRAHIGRVYLERALHKAHQRLQ